MKNWKSVALAVGGAVFALIGLTGSAGLSDEDRPTRGDAAVALRSAAARLDSRDVDILSKLIMDYETLAVATKDSMRAQALNDSAMSFCDKAMRLDPKNVGLAVTAGRLHLNRAILLATTATREDAMPFYEKAAGYLKAAVDLNPQDGPSMFNLGLCYSHQEKFDEAVGVFRRAVALDPKDVDSWAQIGLIQVRQKDLDGAIETFKKVTAIQPDHVRAWEFLASLYAQKDMVKKAKEADAVAQALKDQAEN